MKEAFAALLPIYVGLIAGWLLRHKNILNESAPTVMLRVGFYVVGPAVIYNAVANVQWSNSLLVFPIFSVLAGGLGFLAGKLVVAKVHFAKDRVPVVLMSAMFVNTVFAMMFSIAHYEIEGASRVVLFNIINLPVVYILGHALAAKANPEQGSKDYVLKRVVTSPPVWALVLGVIVNVANVETPAALAHLINVYTQAFVPLAALAIGMCIKFTLEDMRDNVIVMAIRYGVSIVIGVAIVLIAGLDGIDRAIVLCIATAPIGFSTLTFANLENLDQTFAAKSLSISFAFSTILTSSVFIFL